MWLLANYPFNEIEIQFGATDENIEGRSLEAQRQLSVNWTGVKFVTHPQRGELRIFVTTQYQILKWTSASPVGDVSHMKAHTFDYSRNIGRHN